MSRIWKRKRKQRKQRRKQQAIVDLCKKQTGAPPPQVPTKKYLSWWERAPIKYAFSPLSVRTKLEMLMGSNLVSLTDRNYMIYLQDRILDDYDKAVTKRITVRQAEEMERVKNLVLCGKIPLDDAPIEMANHPVMLIDQYCKKVLAERRAKMKVLRPFIPKHLYWDDTPDPPSGLSIESGHLLRPNNDRLCLPPELFLSTEDAENISEGYMLTNEEYDKIHYETDQIKMLRDCQTVEEMYNLADEIIGFVSEGDSTKDVVLEPSDVTMDQNDEKK